MSNNKVYADSSKLRRHSKLACHAIHDLANLGVQVLGVKFRASNPLIEVANCPGTKKLKSALSGQGVNDQGDHYIKRSSAFCGCQVDWQEVQNG